jgi:hypothetical protein
MGKVKQFTFIAVPADTAPRATRLIRGTLREVESKLRGEWEVRRATAEEAHSLRDVEIEDASGEPT